MIDIAGKQIIPAVIKYITSLAQSVNSVKSAVADADVSVQSELLTESSALLSDAQVALAKLKDETAKLVLWKRAESRLFTTEML